MEHLRGHVYRLKPTPEQEILLAQTAGVVRLVYNLALEQRRLFGPRTFTGVRRTCPVTARPRARQGQSDTDHVRKAVPTSAMSLSDELSDLRREFPWIGAVSQTAQNQAFRDLDAACAAFFEGRAGYPRPRKRGVDDSFRHVGREIAVRRLNARWSEVKVPKIGWIRYRDTRPLPAAASGRVEILNATLRRRASGWEIAIAVRCEIAAAPLPRAACGIDRGVAIPYALSTGEAVHLPATMARRERSIRRAQQAASRRQRGSNRHKKAQRRAAVLMRRNAGARVHVAHVLSRRLVQSFGLVAIEDLRITAMTASARGTREEPGRRVAQKAGLNRAIRNVGWHALERMLAYKLQETGGLLIKVKAAYSSQTCAACGHVDARSRESQAIFRCTACGAAHNADINAAQVILQRALAGAEDEAAWRWNTPALDVEGKASAPKEASTQSLARGVETPRERCGNPRPSGRGRC